MNEPDLDAIRARQDRLADALHCGSKDYQWACAISCAGDVACLMVEVERLRAAVAIHQPRADSDQPKWCPECMFAWPCPTVRAAGGDQ